MKKTVLLVGICALLSTSAWADGVTGTWNFPEQNAGGIALDMSLTITQNSITVTNTCKYQDGVSKVAQASSTAVVTDTTIQMLQANASNNDSDPNHTCNASTSVGVMDYTVSGNTLTLTEQGQSIQLTRAQ